MKKKVIIGIAILVGVVAVITGGVVVTDLMQESKLKKEIENITETNFIDEKMDMNIKTKGDYAVIEGVIKAYLTEYITLYEDVKKAVEANDTENILTIENYEKDGPDFIESKKTIENVRKKINEAYSKIKLLASKEEIIRRIEEKKLDSYYVDLYKELMLGNAFEKEMEETIKMVETSGVNVNKYFDLQIEVLTLLVDNAENWYLEDDTIYIEDNAILKRYNRLIEEVGKAL